MSASLWNPADPAGSTASLVPFEPTATIEAENVQDAIEEVDTEYRAAIASLVADLAGTANAAKNAGQLGYNAALAYAANTVGFELNKRKSIFATGVAATDTANLQAAINAAADYTTIEVFGTTLALNATITLKPKLKLKFHTQLVTFSSTSSDMFAYTPGTPTGFPGRILIENLRATGAGNTGTAWALKIDANCPYVMVKDCYLDAFFGGIYLRDAYLSHIEDTFIATVSHGIAFYRESHGSQAVNCFVDSATITALSINYGATGGGPIHNIKVIGGAYQNSPVGIWAENALELHTVDVYHEGNSVNDYRIGVADAGAYARACYSVKIDGFSSASPCGSGKNIQIEHSVGVQILATGWNSGCSTTATLLSADGFCDRIEVDAHRFTTITPTNTAPFDFTAIPERCVVRYRGRHIYGTGAVDGIAWGTLSVTLARIGQQSISSRNTLLLYSLLDMALRVKAPTGIFRVQDDSGNDLLTVDNVNNKVQITKTSLQLTNMPSSNPGAGSKVLWYDPADGNRVKFAP